ncbi:C-type lectin [Penaeus vannamei]|uniref:C-type lectin n=1 Tax=Penaeus vannamei TaxID=6689 RepID=A0A423TD12_PENVA|nr:C-type lectin [Penaeus vannamei]
MMSYLPLIFTCALFAGKVEGRVTWNRTKLESFQPGVATTTSTPPEQDCPGGYSLVGDKCLLFVTFVAEPYGEARQFCHAAKGELAAITTATDFKNTIDYIHANGLSGTSFWLDGSDEAAEGVWVTSSGEAVPLGTPFWAAFPNGQQPDNNNGNEHYLCLSSSWFLYMNDASSSATINFICEATIQKKTASAALAPFGPSAGGAASPARPLHRGRRALPDVRHVGGGDLEDARGRVWEPPPNSWPSPTSKCSERCTSTYIKIIYQATPSGLEDPI